MANQEIIWSETIGVEANVPLLPPIPVTSITDSFDQDLYNLNSSSHLYAYMSALLGDQGAEGIKLRAYIARLGENVWTKFFADLDQEFSVTYGLPRDWNETYGFDTNIDLLTRKERDIVKIRDSQYRERLRWILTAIQRAATKEAISLVVRGVTGNDCLVYEGYRESPDSTVIGKLGYRDTNEIVVYPYGEVNTRQRQLISHIWDRVKPTGSIVTLKTNQEINSLIDLHIPVKSASSSSSSSDYEIESYVDNSSIDRASLSDKLTQLPESFKWLLKEPVDTRGSLFEAERYGVERPKGSIRLENDNRIDLIGGSLRSVIYEQYTYSALEPNKPEVRREIPYTTRQDTITSYSSWQEFERADSPDNYPGGKFGITPLSPPALDLDGVNYIWPYISQEDYITKQSERIIAQKGEVLGNSYRFLVSDVQTSESYYVSKSIKQNNNITTSYNETGELVLNDAYPLSIVDLAKKPIESYWKSSGSPLLDNAVEVINLGLSLSTISKISFEASPCYYELYYRDTEGLKKPVILDTGEALGTITNEKNETFHFIRFVPNIYISGILEGDFIRATFSEELRDATVSFSQTGVRPNPSFKLQTIDNVALLFTSAEYAYRTFILTAYNLNGTKVEITVNGGYKIQPDLTALYVTNWQIAHELTASDFNLYLNEENRLSFTVQGDLDTTIDYSNKITIANNSIATVAIIQVTTRVYRLEFIYTPTEADIINKNLDVEINLSALVSTTGNPIKTPLFTAHLIDLEPPVLLVKPSRLGLDQPLSFSLAFSKLMGAPLTSSSLAANPDWPDWVNPVNVMGRIADNRDKEVILEVSPIVFNSAVTNGTLDLTPLLPYFTSIWKTPVEMDKLTLSLHKDPEIFELTGPGPILGQVIFSTKILRGKYTVNLQLNEEPFEPVEIEVIDPEATSFTIPEEKTRRFGYYTLDLTSSRLVSFQDTLLTGDKIIKFDNFPTFKVDVPSDVITDVSLPLTVTFSSEVNTEVTAILTKEEIPPVTLVFTDTGDKLVWETDISSLENGVYSLAFSGDIRDIYGQELVSNTASITIQKEEPNGGRS
jgi:hypothetical protein